MEVLETLLMLSEVVFVVFYLTVSYSTKHLSVHSCSLYSTFVRAAWQYLIRALDWY